MFQISYSNGGEVSECMVSHCHHNVEFGIMSSVATCFRFVAPVEAVLLIIWWAIDLISNETESGQKWYEFGRETFMVTIVQVCQFCINLCLSLCVCVCVCFSLCLCLSLFLFLSVSLYKYCLLLL